MPSRYASVADYYATLAPAQLHTMRELLDFVIAEFPQLDVKIAWNKPHVHRNGHYVLGVDAARKHLMFHPWSVPVFERFLPRLTGYVTGKRTFQIPLGWQLDQALIRDIVTAQLAEMA
ncbi:MAG: iron chaperone [Roseiflexaceae bacterium]